MSTSIVSQSTTIPSELCHLDQWVTWRSEPAAKPGGKRRKVLYTPGTDRKASSTDPATWRPHTEAVAAVERGEAAGIGFVFGDDDPYFGIDLDTCRDIDTGAIEPWAAEILARFNTYAEISPNGTGVHLIGRGVKPGSDCRKGAQIECYDSARYFTMTGDVLPGYERIRNVQRVLTAWHHEVWPTAPTISTMMTAPSLTLNDRDVIDRLTNERNGKAARLITGDASGHPSPSEARAALAFKACFYSTDAEQVARILITSGLFKDDTPERERERKAERDATKALADYTGPRHNPGFGMASTPPSTGTATVVPDADIDAFSCADARAQLKVAQRTIAEQEARIASQQRTIQYERGRLHDIETILANSEIESGPSKTLAGLYLELNEQVARGRTPKEKGFQIPSVWIARRTGQTATAVGRHLRILAKKHIIAREVENVTEEYIDGDSGEILTLAIPRKVGFIATRPEAIIVNLADYKRTADAKRHGGKREALETPPYCEDHPDAGTVTHTIIECRECGMTIDRKRTEQEPDAIIPPDLDATGTDDGRDILYRPYPRVVNSLDRHKMYAPDRPTPPSIRPADLAARLAANGWD
jgi:hypothetical protein